MLLPLGTERAGDRESYTPKKVQDNISKRAAIEKVPLTLEKDKEDQSKYYLSYPTILKPPILDMKWANRDINVIEWANIPKFSTIENIVTPLRLLELFFGTY